MINSITNALPKQTSRYLAIAFDYDGTLANDGHVAEDVILALREVVRSGRRLILVTGRRLEELLKVFQAVDIFDVAVCENGALLYTPSTKAIKMLAPPPTQDLVQAIQAKGVTPIELGRSIIATWRPNEERVLEVIQELGSDWQITFNKRAVMVLPPGINKASGLTAALRQLGLSRHNVIGVGDAENDIAFLNLCECSAAVANALPVLKSQADLATKSDHGFGVIELIEDLLTNKLSDHSITRHDLLLGTTAGGESVTFSSDNITILLAGPSQSGKSTICRSLIKQFAENGYQYCAIDPEGDHDRTSDALTIGNSHYPPDIDDILLALENPEESVVVNMLGLAFSDRPSFVARLLFELQKMRQTLGHPHWIIIDEAHHVLHPYWDETIKPAWEGGGANILVTIDPREISSSVLSSVDLAIAVGQDPASTLSYLAETVNQSPPNVPKNTLGWGEAIAWFRHNYGEPLLLKIACSAHERKRHARKYAYGDVGKERSFYFTGADKRLNIKVQNLILFMQVAEGLDESTWLFHLRNGDYSNWFDNVIHDSTLASETRKVERNTHIGARESRSLIKELIERRYTLPSRLFT
ncbi:MAG: HAD family hydrolase [Candidatus Obscuribacterales bacterium]|nr:HAD family hydrolase [Candidatus Obscuribacterales bacterium]